MGLRGSNRSLWKSPISSLFHSFPLTIVLLRSYPPCSIPPYHLVPALASIPYFSSVPAPLTAKSIFLCLPFPMNFPTSPPSSFTICEVPPHSKQVRQILRKTSCSLRKSFHWFPSDSSDRAQIAWFIIHACTQHSVKISARSVKPLTAAIDLPIRPIIRNHQIELKYISAW